MRPGIEHRRQSSIPTAIAPGLTMPAAATAIGRQAERTRHQYSTLAHPAAHRARLCASVHPLVNYVNIARGSLYLFTV